MDEQEMKTPENPPEEEFLLEDIMKEFGGEEPEETADAGDTVVIPDISRLVEQTREEPPQTQDDDFSDTIRLDTIRPDGEALKTTQVKDAQPVEEPEEECAAEERAEEAAPEAPAAQETAVAAEEAFAGDWEPEYEEPMGEYTPAPTVIVHPRSRLKELKKKLIAGPEKRYYELLEKGLGRIQVAIFLNFLLVITSAALSALYAFGSIPDTRLRAMVFFQLLALFLSALIGSNQLVEGVADLFKKRFTLNTLLVLTFLVCCADGIFGLMEQRIPCCAAFSLEMTMSLWNAYHRRNTEMGQMDTMRKATRLDKLSACPDYLEGRKGFLRGDGQVEDFMDAYQDTPVPEKVSNWYALAATVAAAAAGVTAGLLYGLSTGFFIAAVTLLAAVPATMHIAVSRPFGVLERRLHRLGAVLCGWQGVEGLCGKALFPLEHKDLFPAGSVRMNGVKFFGQRDTDQVVAFATALICVDNGCLKPVFDQCLESRNGCRFPVSEYRDYGDGGIGGQVCGEAVLVGSLSFLKRMGVEIPEGLRVNSAVCVAVDGELCGLFALTFDKVRDSAAGMVTLGGYRGLKLAMSQTDVMLTGTFLSSIFGINPKKLVLPEAEERQKLASRKQTEEDRALALATAGGLSPFAFCVTGARALKTATIWGLVLHMLGGILGIGVVVAMVLMGTMQYLTPMNMFLYQLVWIVPALLITEWTRSV